MTHLIPPPPKPRLFLRRPPAPLLPLNFLSRAARLPGKTLAVALALCVLAQTVKSPNVVLSSSSTDRFAISSDAVLDGLTRLSDAGLIQTSRSRGRHAEVTILDDEVRRMICSDAIPQAAI